MRGGLKRKIEIQKRETKTQRAVACSKRRKGVFKKAAEVSITTGAKIAVYATSPSENSGAIYSFSSHSAYEIAQCFLNNEIPSKPISNLNPKSNHWWENLEFDHSVDPYQLQNLIDRLRKARDDAIAAFTKKNQNQFVWISQNPNFPNGREETTALERVGGNDSSVGEGLRIDAVDENEKVVEITENFVVSPTSGAFLPFEEISQIDPLNQISRAYGSQSNGIVSDIGMFDQTPDSAIVENFSGISECDSFVMPVLTEAFLTFQEISQIDPFDQMSNLTTFENFSNTIEDEEDEFLIEIEKYS